MEFTYTTLDGRFSTKLVGETEVSIIDGLVDFQNLIEKNNVCGLCKSEEVYWNVREVDGSRYYEKKCSKCYAALPYHQNKPKVKNGGLYFSYKDKWAKYVPEPKDESEEENTNKKTGKK